MILLQVLHSEYFDDVQALVKAFYPEVDVHQATFSMENAKEVFQGAFQLTKKADANVYERARGAEREKWIPTLLLEVVADSLNEEGEQFLVTVADSTGECVVSRKETTKNLRKDLHDTCKVAVYEALWKMTGRKLPWGIMMGVRPSKPALNGLMRKESMESIQKLYRNHYFVSEGKISLATTVARVEQELLARKPYEEGYSLYLGIPFCPTRCLYCSFAAYPLEAFAREVDRYVEALAKEIRVMAGILGKKRLDTIYFGGGTPTSLTPKQLDRLLGVIEDSYDLHALQELTVEAGRPDSVDLEKFRVLKEHGVKRVSVNPQTMNQKTLDEIGRFHSVEDVKRAYALARSVGFESINMDIILGLPGEGEQELAHTLREIEEMHPDNLTVHSLAVKRAANLSRRKEEYRGTMHNDETFTNMAADCAKRLGMRPYYMYRQKNMTGNMENVGYAIPGTECLYNVLIMEEVQTIIACGAGGSSKFVYGDNRIERAENVKYVRDYMDRVDEMVERKAAFLKDMGWMI
ncbi:MAG: coproporphyrinogen dehydrogenase HemZ [Lachnospiraceae bacterium]|nr:coproporphyrinogen dehydrogenase HemZ [Lachnospiraceae bacterium]